MPRKAELYRLTPLAEADLEEIWLYTFENWSAEQANVYIADLVIAFEHLAWRLRTGRRVDARDGYFKCAVGSHFVFYVQSDAGIDVIRILHQRMDIEKHLL
jgi:toxin ParE1/3/4